ncbi:MAG: hypothetical protein U0359_33685 [Byssovorax sp.]
MLIHLDASAVASVLEQPSLSERSLLCIENLLRAHHGLKHVVSLRRDDARTLRRLSSRLSEPARGALDSITGKLSEIDGLRKTIPWHMEVGIGPSFDGSVATRADRRVIRADLHHFSDFERLGRTILLGENLTDAELYDVMGRAFMAHRGFRHRLAFERRGGGGSTLAAAFLEAAKDGRILLAVADSDRTHPQAGVGGTAQGLDLGPMPAFQRSQVLHVRSAENLLAFEVYEEALGPHRETPSLPERLMALDRLVPRTVCDWRSYANLKHGLRLAEIQRMDHGAGEGSFWTEVGRCGQRDRCASKSPCRNEAECTCFVIDALGPRALDRAVAWMRSQPPARLANLLDFAHDTILTDLCSQIVAWGIAQAGRPI